MKIDFRVTNPIATSIPLDYKIYKQQQEQQKQNEQQQTISVPVTTTSEPIKKRTNRSEEQFRQIFMKTGVVSQASGSAYIEIENTKVICSVHGPRASPKTELFESAKFSCELKFASFARPGERIDYMESAKEKDLSINLRQSIIGAIRLEKYPKTVIDVYVMVLNDDGGVLVAAITAASMALADAGVEMYDMVSACSSICIRNQSISNGSNGSGSGNGSSGAAPKVQSSILLDPTLQEEESKDSLGCVVVAKMPSLNEITQIIQTGELSYNNTIDGIDLCIDGCDKIYSIMKQNLISSLEKQVSKKLE
ncbi:hypothetical protein DFA_05820 [Cavenderia fasciculata]|uniref:Exoribonuclease phosphorolytic domain-containing protein n=1 Tax=Cavenderia fasciculata TaxID=261658 RepID=F4PMU2_CACFS|nr:uncharacterized protein DFA_05820 [Cavenderia fasciculata]EGG23686.1 hypothetical protein DFA_05820 [Cavenderia fasciculata]|eukprot:XP_004361537.1 hypothetical protein DFA_05820 [Cavenderia fasciculata]